MNVLQALMGWATGQTMGSYSKPSRVKQRFVSPRHPTKKGPGRSKGSDAMASHKKAFVRNGGVLVKLPKNIPSGIAPQGRYRKGENPIGTNVRA